MTELDFDISISNSKLGLPTFFACLREVLCTLADLSANAMCLCLGGIKESLGIPFSH
ncbi:hypothetical protein DIPPA_22690 [Diplonema papillatum]|nr:hypothetical protein DIPPA_22690 [Diplonema papillatum]